MPCRSASLASDCPAAVLQSLGRGFAEGYKKICKIRLKHERKTKFDKEHSDADRDSAATSGVLQKRIQDLDLAGK